MREGRHPSLSFVFYVCGSKVKCEEGEVNFLFGEGLRLLIQTPKIFPKNYVAWQCVGRYSHVLLLSGDFLNTLTIRPDGASAGAPGSHYSVLFIPQN